MHPTRVLKADGNLLTQAEMNIMNGEQADYQYVRAVVIDEDGRFAWTNPIFLPATQEQGGYRAQ